MTKKLEKRIKDLLDIYNNNYIIMTDKEMNTFCRLFMITNHISENDEESVLNNIVLLENMMKKILEKNKDYTNSIKKEILYIGEKYKKDKYLFEGQNFDDKFNLNSNLLNENLVYLNYYVLDVIEKEELRLEVLKKLDKMKPYLSEKKYKNEVKILNEMIDSEKYDDESYSQYLKKLKTCELTKILNDNSIQRVNNIKENLKRKGNIKNEEIYDRMLNCEIKGKELVLFLNKYNNNLVNNKKK